MAGRSVSAVDNLPGDSDCLQLPLSGCEAEKQTTTIDGVPEHHNSQLPSPALSNHTSPESKGGARPGQHPGIMFEDLPSEVSCCGEQTRALTVSASNSPTATPSIASSRDASTDCEDNNISVLPSLNLQPQRKGKQLRSNSPFSRVLRSRVNTESNRHDRSPSVAVVIPVRRSARSMAGTSRDSLVQPSHCFHQASASCGSQEDQPKDSFTGNHSRFTRKAAADGREHPQKRRRRNVTSKTAQNTSLSARCHSKGSIATLEAPSGFDFLPSPGETQEIFGRGIIRIQPHGQRHAYFLTFLPDAVDRPPSHVQPRSAPDQPLCTKCAPHTSSKACAVEKGNVQLAHRQTQNPRANTKTRNNHSTRHKDSRKRMSWSPEEDELLVKLKRDQRLPWSDVTRLFSEQYPGRTQGSIQVYWSTNLSKRSPLNFCPRSLPSVSSSNESWKELLQPADEQNGIPIDPVILTNNGLWDAEDERQHIHADGNAVISETICRYPNPPPLLRDTLADDRNSNAYPEAQEGKSQSDSPLRNQSRAQVSADDNNPEAHIRASNNPPGVPNSAQLSKPCKRKLQQPHGQPRLCKRVRGSS